MSAKNLLRKIVLPALIMFSQITYSQGKTVTGKVTDSKDGNGVSGVTVVAKGSRTGTQTGPDGTYQITISSSVTVLVFSSVGYASQEVSINGRSTVDVVLEITNTTLTEVVTIGYGTARKKDVTGSVTLVTTKDFNKGPATTPEQLLIGKVSGVQITTGGGAPGAGTRIRIRNGSSLNASNSPLIVIDGVPLDNNDISGTANPLSLINSNDIESINILKDASATAIYGNRASNGVIIITTKKGKAGNLHISFSSVTSQYRREDQVDVLNAEQYKALVTAHGTSAQIALLGTANTNWQGAIYKNAIGTDNNISFTGGLKNFIPYRLSLGYLNQDGILKTDNLQRTSVALNLNPKLLNNSLSIDINAKFAVNKSTFANQGAIGAAVFFDPTHPIYAPSVNGVDLGGYFEWLNANGNGQPNTLASRNPISLLMQRSDKGTAKRGIGNIQFDYKLPWVPGLRANYNFGFDVSNGYGDVIVPATAASAYYVGGSKSHYSQTKSNVLSEFYLNYARNLNEIKSRFDVQAGYTYQDWIRESPSYPTINGNGTIPASTPFKTQNTLISIYGRVNYGYDDRYLLTATVRHDGSSRFTGDNQWGTFPSVAFAWRISRESFLQGSKILSDLKLRFGWGITGQQDIGGDYDYLPRYTLSDSSAMYSFGNTYYFTYRPQGYDENLRWEQTTTWNGGLDFGFLNGRITGSVDYYFKKTKDLLANISVPAGSNLTNQITTNVGNMENKGVEVILSGTPYKSRHFTWDAGFNFTYNEKTITNLSKVKDSTSIGYLVGGIAGGVGNTVQINSVGYSPNSFYVYKQVYNQSGLPVEGLYVDLNKSGAVTTADKYRYKNPEPRIYMGFSSQLTYKNLSLAFSMRASIDNYMYNNFKSNNGTYQNFAFPNYLGNVSSITPKYAFIGNDPNRYWSDLWIENASFLKMDYISLAYNIGSITKTVGMRLSATVQNVFTITKYTGLDPEIAGGIDNNFYPRPRIFSLGVNIDFQK